MIRTYLYNFFVGGLGVRWTWSTTTPTFKFGPLPVGTAMIIVGVFCGVFLPTNDSYKMCPKFNQYTSVMSNNVIFPLLASTDGTNSTYCVHAKKKDLKVCDMVNHFRT